MKGYNDWINTRPKDVSSDELEKIWDATASYRSGYKPNVDAGHDDFMKRISQSGQSGRVVSIRPAFRWQRIAAAVAILLVAGFAINNFFLDTPYQTHATNNNDTIALDLEEGTTVTLNKSSSLSYPEQFTAQERLVKLTGEAFFDVTKDPKRPFKIETPEAFIEVLGTSFNVKSSPSDHFLEVFVKTGSVKVTAKDGGHSKVLKPGDVYQLDFEENQVLLSKDPEEKALNWRKNKLVFKNQPLSSIFEQLGDFYEVQFDLQDASLKSCPFTINLTGEELKDALDAIKETCSLEIELTKDKQYMVSGSCCE